MGYKGLVMDIDGTLYNSAKRITETTRRAVFRAREAGKVIAIASGRPIRGIADVSRRLQLAEKGGYIMGWNSGKILNAQTGEVISETTLPEGIVSEIAALAREYDVPVVAHTAGLLLSETPEDEIIQLEARLNYMRNLRRWRKSRRSALRADSAYTVPSRTFWKFFPPA